MIFEILWFVFLYFLIDIELFCILISDRQGFFLSVCVVSNIVFFGFILISVIYLIFLIYFGQFIDYDVILIFFMRGNLGIINL